MALNKGFRQQQQKKKKKRICFYWKEIWQTFAHILLLFFFALSFPLYCAVSEILLMLMQTEVQSVCPPSQGSDADTVTHFSFNTFVLKAVCQQLVVIC